MKLLGYNITPVNATMPAGRRRKSTAQAHALQQKYQTREDLRTLRLAIEISNTIENYNRYELHQIYRKVFNDPEFAAQWNTRVLKTQDKEFHIESIEGGISKTHKKLFTAPWFFKWIELVLEYRMWGFSLIEFGPWEDNTFVPYIDTTGRYHTAVEVVDRDYTKPEFGTIVRDYGDGIGMGVSYFNNRFSDRLMFVGGYDKTYDILYKSSAYMLMKENTIRNWSEWAEVFAMDMRVGKTQQQGTQRNEFIKAIRDMGSNGYAVIDEEDVIEYTGVNRQDAYKVYESFLEYIDARIAKLIFGQDVVTNNTGRVVGKVGEEISNMYGDADAKFIEWTVNTQLIPFMAKHGAEVDGITFKYDTTEKIKLTERAKVDKAIADMGWKHSQEYLVRTYGVELDEFTGVPFSGREGQENNTKKE